MTSIKVTGGSMTPEEKKLYLDYLIEKYPGRVFKSIEFHIDGDYVDMKYTYDDKPFVRIRRITGYLVGDLSRWNDSKRAEEHDRVHHSTEEED